MPKLKASQLRELSPRELEEQLETLKSELSRLRFQARSKNMEKPSMISQTRRTIARILTVLKERKNASGAR